MELSDKLVVITEASGGIGRATALALAERGCKLVIHASEWSETITELADEIKTNVEMTVIADFRDLTAISAMFMAIKNEKTYIDAFVNTARFEECFDNSLDTSQWSETLTMNLLAPVECVRHAVELMKSGVIVDVSSANPFTDTQSISHAIANAGLSKAFEHIEAMLAPKHRVVEIGINKDQTDLNKTAKLVAAVLENEGVRKMTL